MQENTISKRLQLMLKNLGMMQKELADKAGTTEAAISRYVNGSRLPSCMALINIANAAKVSPSWILGMGSDDQMERM